MTEPNAQTPPRPEQDSNNNQTNEEEEDPRLVHPIMPAALPPPEGQIPKYLNAVYYGGRLAGIKRPVKAELEAMGEEEAARQKIEREERKEIKAIEKDFMRGVMDEERRVAKEKKEAEKKERKEKKEAEKKRKEEEKQQQEEQQEEQTPAAEQPEAPAEEVPAQEGEEGAATKEGGCKMCQWLPSLHLPQLPRLPWFAKDGETPAEGEEQEEKPKVVPRRSVIGPRPNATKRPYLMIMAEEDLPPEEEVEKWRQEQRILAEEEKARQELEKARKAEAKKAEKEAKKLAKQAKKDSKKYAKEHKNDPPKEEEEEKKEEVATPQPSASPAASKAATPSPARPAYVPKAATPAASRDASPSQPATTAAAEPAATPASDVVEKKDA